MDLIEYTKRYSIGTPITHRKLNPIDKRSGATKFNIVYFDPIKKSGKRKRLSANNSLDAISKFRRLILDRKIGDSIDKPQRERAFKYPEQDKEADRYHNNLNRLGKDVKESTQSIRLQGISK